MQLECADTLDEDPNDWRMDKAQSGEKQTVVRALWFELSYACIDMWFGTTYAS